MLISSDDIRDFERAYDAYCQNILLCYDRIEERELAFRLEHPEPPRLREQPNDSKQEARGVYLAQKLHDAWSEAQTRFRDADVEYIAASGKESSTILAFYSWLAENPQVFIAAGMREYVGASTLPLYNRVAAAGLLKGPRPIFRTSTGSWLLPSSVSEDPTLPWDAYDLARLEAIRQPPTRWVSTSVSIIDGVRTEKVEEDLEFPDDEFPDHQSAVVSLPSFQDLLAAASRILASPLLDPTLLVSPKLWTPSQARRTLDLVAAPAQSLIQAVNTETKALSDLHWRELELVVAEILRARGMEVVLAETSPQGGRDIIARWEIIPGQEPITLAVEVKHRSRVGRPSLHAALHQNRFYPALLFATSGSFTAGVIREAMSPENRLRLMLWDGATIRNLTRIYPLSGSLTIYPRPGEQRGR